jgi:16S rRNA (uracil1498-N3)-methyltransferase
VAARFFAPDASEVGQIVSLPVFEAEHLTRVLRLGTGALVHLLNGRGLAFEGVVTHAARGRADVRIAAPRAAAREWGVRITLAPALLKGDKMDDVVRDAVMMGVAAIQPILADRSEVSRGALVRSHRQERWSRIAVSSAKQCDRALVPDVRPVITSLELLQQISDAGERMTGCMFVEPAAGAAAEGLDRRLPHEQAVVLIGPEGGWSHAELEAARPWTRHVTLRGPIMRADAMPLVGMAALLTAWGEI